MRSCYIREQKRYSQRELIDLFEYSTEPSKAINVLTALKSHRILKMVKRKTDTKDQLSLSDLMETDVIYCDIKLGDNEHYYIFSYVGIVVVGEIIIKCYPKYLLSSERPKKELKQVMEVLEKYDRSKDQKILMSIEDNDKKTVNLLGVMLYLLKDYFENGTYTNTQYINEINGSGEILWDRTINETFTFISNNRPYYPELITRKVKNDDLDYFKRLHECILTQCSRELNDAELLYLLGLSEVDISDEELDDFGEKEYILERITKELNVQFNTRKQMILKTLYSYIASEVKLTDSDSFSMLGSNNFNLVWEKVCSNIMNDQLDTLLGSIPLPVKLCAEYNKKSTLLSLIEKPVWHGKTNDNEYFTKTAEKTLKPDTVTIANINGNYHFIIFDAKYYNIQLERDKELDGQPGIESITKQYLYQLAYMDFIEKHQISTVKNCFLMPTEADEIIDKGYVDMKMFQKLKLENIQIRLIPAHRAFSLYLQEQHLEISELNL